MKRTILTAVLVAVAAVPVALAGLPAPPVPHEIALDGPKPYLVLHAVGVQIYQCQETGWTFVAPRANLYNKGKKLIATHFAGPTWRAKDGSTVVATRLDGVTVDPSAIPWLLLMATSTTRGKIGKTTYIQRIATVGGVAPAASQCNLGTLGDYREVPYTADYVFLKGDPVV